MREDRLGTPNPLLEARRERQRAIDEPLASIAAQATERGAAAWSEEVKQAARAARADEIGITATLRNVRLRRDGQFVRGLFPLRG